MARFIKSRKERRGLPPGSLIHLNKGSNTVFKITSLSYNQHSVNETFVQNLEECIPEAKSKDTVTWVDVEGLTDIKTIESIGKAFGVHRLWLEDVLNTDHRPKVSELNDLLFVIIKSVQDYQKNKKIIFEQISLFLGENFVLSFQEHPDDLFAVMKKRIIEGKGRIRSANSDYLFYAIMDFVLDNYFIAIENVGKEIESLEPEITEKQTPDIPDRIMVLKNELLYLNKSAIPIKDSLAHIVRSNSKDISAETKIYFQDALEHAVQVVDTIEHYRQMLDSLMTFYDGKVNQKLNEVMKVLTIFASIFIPLTFIAGIYGMNFENMPELKWANGYFYALTFMGSIFCGLLIYFKRKKWF